MLHKTTQIILKLIYSKNSVEELSFSAVLLQIMVTKWTKVITNVNGYCHGKESRIMFEPESEWMWWDTYCYRLGLTYSTQVTRLWQGRAADDIRMRGQSADSYTTVTADYCNSTAYQHQTYTRYFTDVYLHLLWLKAYS